MKILHDLAAAITFFTRIPIWKFVAIPAESYKRMIYFWPLTGWITAGITALSWYTFSFVFPSVICILLAIIVRMLLTGAFHEDGLGDFMDGFGGGHTKADILRIMKDSHAGSYSVLGLIGYMLLLTASLMSLPATLVPVAILSADPLSKFATSIMMNILPYARPESESKSKTVYTRLRWWQLLIAFVTGCLPFIHWLAVPYLAAALAPFMVMSIILLLSKKKINGYTGDVCGATTLLAELGFYLALVALTTHTV